MTVIHAPKRSKMEYKDIPEEIRLRIEEHLAASSLREEWKEEARRQINEIHWIAAKNPHPVRLRWLSFRLKMGIYYQRVCRFLGL